MSHVKLISKAEPGPVGARGHEPAGARRHELRARPGWRWRSLSKPSSPGNGGGRDLGAGNGEAPGSLASHDVTQRAVPAPGRIQQVQAHAVEEPGDSRVGPAQRPRDRSETANTSAGSLTPRQARSVICPQSSSTRPMRSGTTGPCSHPRAADVTARALACRVPACAGARGGVPDHIGQIQPPAWPPSGLAWRPGAAPGTQPHLPAQQARPCGAANPLRDVS